MRSAESASRQASASRGSSRNQRSKTGYRRRSVRSLARPWVRPSLPGRPCAVADVRLPRRLPRAAPPDRPGPRSCNACCRPCRPNAASAVLPQRTTRCHSVFSWRCPPLSFQISVVAMLSVATGAPPGVYRSSASRPRFPTRMTLFTLPMPGVLSRVQPF